MRRVQVPYVAQRGRSERRAWRFADRSIHCEVQSRMASRRAADRTAARARKSVLQIRISRHPRLMARRGHAMSMDRMHRSWRVAKLQAPRKRPREARPVHAGSIQAQSAQRIEQARPDWIPATVHRVLMRTGRSCTGMRACSRSLTRTNLVSLIREAPSCGRRPSGHPCLSRRLSQPDALRCFQPSERSR